MIPPLSPEEHRRVVEHVERQAQLLLEEVRRQPWYQPEDLEPVEVAMDDLTTTGVQPSLQENTAPSVPWRRVA